MAPTDGQNRVVAVLSIRVSAVGSAYVSGQAGSSCEPEEPGEGLLLDVLDALGRFQGRVERIRGNEVLAVFGAPLSHEDDPERAVLAALEIRARAKERGLVASAGVCTGEVSFGPAGAEEHHELTVTGPVESLAARLQARARPGEIILSESAGSRVRGSFDLTPRSRRVQDGESASFVVEGQRERPQKTRGLEGLRSELIGREAELGALEEAYAGAASGEGRVVCLTGEAGVGKSRLAAELRDRVLRPSTGGRSLLWLEGRCLELGASSPYGPFVDMLGRYFKFSRADAGRAACLTQGLEALRNMGAFTAQRVAEIGPLLGRLFSVSFATEWDLRLAHTQPQQIKHQACVALRDVLLAAPAGGPMVILLDDLHWADSLSMDAVALLMESIPDAPVLLLCVFRPVTGHRCCQLPAIAARILPGRSSQVALHELSPTESQRLIESLLAAEALPPELCNAILAQSQGNPFFVEEVIRSLIESGAVRREGTEWRVRRAAPAALVPQTLQSVIMSRVDALEPGHRHVLESAAVIGSNFSADVLSRAAEEVGCVPAALAEMESVALICRQGAASELQYSFRHVLTRQTVYQSILRRRLARLHARTAEAIESLHPGSEGDCEELARHWELAGNLPKAVRSLLGAGEKARKAYMNQEAVGFLQRAVELAGAADRALDRERFRALLEMGKVHEHSGSHALAETALRQAVDLGRQAAAEPRELAEALYFLVKAITSRHRPAEYLPLAEEYLSLVASHPDSLEVVLGEFVVALASMESGNGDFSPLCAFADRRKELIRALPYSQELAIDVGYAAWAHFVEKNDAAALEWLDWLEGEALMHNDLLILAAACVRRGRDGLAPRGDLLGAVETVGKATELYRMVGARYLEARCHLYLGDIWYRSGRLEEAENSRARAVLLCRGMEEDPHLAAERGMLEGEIALSRGDARAALLCFEAAIASGPGVQWESHLRLLLGRALMDLGRRKEAAERFLGLLESVTAFRIPPAYSLTTGIVHLLSLLEECFERGEDFRTACYLLRKRRPFAGSLLRQWHLEPSPEPTQGKRIVADSLCGIPADWDWEDPAGDCSIRSGDGLAISAPVGRGLAGANTGAPRLLRCAPGGLAAEVTVEAAAEGTPAAGGLLLWKDRRNYVRIDQGSLGSGQLCFEGCIASKDCTLGRGKLPYGPVKLHLRRDGGLVQASCSPGGRNWYGLGETEFPPGGGARIGLFADSALRPEIYPRTFAAGSAVRFRDFVLSEA